MHAVTQMGIEPACCFILMAERIRKCLQQRVSPQWIELTWFQWCWFAQIDKLDRPDKLTDSEHSPVMDALNLLNQASSSLLQTPKKVKTWAIGMTKSPQGKGAEWPREHWCAWIWNPKHAVNARGGGGFAKTHMCGYKESHAYLSCCMHLNCEPAVLSHKYDSLIELSLLGSVAA